MSELGLNGLLIPESYGGGGQTILEGAFVYEELGRAMAPTPHFVSCVVSAKLLLEAEATLRKMLGSRDRQRRFDSHASLARARARLRRSRRRAEGRSPTATDSRSRAASAPSPTPLRPTS